MMSKIRERESLLHLFFFESIRALRNGRHVRLAEQPPCRDWLPKNDHAVRGVPKWVVAAGSSNGPWKVWLKATCSPINYHKCYTTKYIPQ